MRKANSKKPLTRVSTPAPGVHRKRGLERGWQNRLAKGWQKGLAERVGRKGWQKGLAERVGRKGWQKGLAERVGTGLAKGWRMSLHPPICNSRGARLEDRVCDSIEVGGSKNAVSGRLIFYHYWC